MYFTRSLFVHIFNFEFIVVNFHEIHYKMNEMLTELGQSFFLGEKSPNGHTASNFQRKFLSLKNNSPNFAPFGVRAGLSPQGCLPVNAKSD